MFPFVRLGRILIAFSGVIETEDPVANRLLSVLSKNPLISLGEEAGFRGLRYRAAAGTENIASQCIAITDGYKTLQSVSLSVLHITLWDSISWVP